jgi:NAD(P)H-dependent flavin oxidoreductase YrpB (nitropropane dioxygenase family)
LLPAESRTATGTASLALGAQGVWLGTVWLTTEEHRLNRHILEKLLKAGSADTVLTRSHSGKTCRVVRSAWSEDWDAEGAGCSRCYRTFSSANLTG